MKCWVLLVLAAAVGTGTVAHSGTRFVWRDNPNTPVSPYDGGWGSAATNIQDAIDASLAGDLILVTNGVYDFGGRIAAGDTTLKTRVVVDKAVTVSSVNGPEGTLIVGAAHTNLTNGGLGDAAVRGVYLADGAMLSGFTVTNGFTRSGTSSANHFYGGGIRAAAAGSIISNCVITANVAATRGGGVFQGTVVNSTVRDNQVRVGSSSAGGGGVYGATCTGVRLENNQTLGTSTDGGGGYQGSFADCTIEANTAGRDGGGIYSGAVVTNCVVIDNTATRNGGGVYNAMVYHSELRANRALGTSATTGSGGGFYASATTYEAHRSRLLDNEANYRGGGAYQGRFYSCVFSGNRAAQGGGFYGSTTYWLNSCSVLDNRATDQYGGTYSGTIKNTILYANEAPENPNWGSGSISYSCTEPLPSGTGNFTANPLVSSYADPHLLPGSPCLGSGLVEAWMTGATDIDGEPRVVDTTTDLGADQQHPASLSGPLSVEILAATNVCAVGYPHPMRAEATGRVNSILWEFGDGTAVSGENPVAHAFPDAGSYAVRVTVANTTHQATGTFEVTAVESIAHVSPSGTHVPPFETWATAATNLQEAVDAVPLPGGLVLVTNGVYDVGGRAVAGQSLTNRLTLDRAVRVRSVNGPSETLIVGCWHLPETPLGTNAIRGVYVGGSAQLDGFTVTNGATCAASSSNEGRGGGLFLEAGGFATNCVVLGNRAWSGGGAASEPGAGGTLFACELTGSEALTVSVTSGRGGGAANLTLVGCRVDSNRAYYGGGAADCVLEGCELTGNSGTVGGGSYQGTLRQCRLLENTASSNGGGAYEGTLYSCVVAGGSAQRGGGVYGTSANGGLFSSTVVGNTASTSGGGLYGSANYPVRNSILYYNQCSTASDYYLGTISHSCATPLPPGQNNIDGEPQLASLQRPYLLPGSPCLGAGLAEDWMNGASDFEGEPRTMDGSVDIGADQVQPDSFADPLAVAIVGPDWPYYPDTPYPFEARIEGHPVGLRWDFGDGTGVDNASLVSHAWSEGSYTLRLTVSNLTHTAGATLRIEVAPDTRYVSPAGSHTPPFLTWETAANDIQSAVDLVLAGGRVWVAAGVYDQGGRASGAELLNNRVLVDKTITLQAVDGPEQTLIVGAPSSDPTNGGLGDGAVRGVRLAAGATLAGFTVTNGHTRYSSTGTSVDYLGGGIYCMAGSSVVSNCVVVGNRASARGGGVFQGTILNSTLATNQTLVTTVNAGRGGGACDALLVSNCVVRANSTGGDGGGLYRGAVIQSVLDGNSALGSGGGHYADGAEDILRDCVVVNNTAGRYGGAIYQAARVYDCLLTNNQATLGGGYYMSVGLTPSGRLYRCRLMDNRATESGGGTYCGELYSCVLSGNTAGRRAGGAYNATLESCSVLGNTAATSGGGISSGTAYYSLIYYNQAPSNPNFSGTTLYGCCTTPSGEPNTYGIVTTPPQISGFRDPHLLPGSRCIDGGDSRAWMTGAEGFDLDGEARKIGFTSDIGADERHADSLTGPLAVAVVTEWLTFGPAYVPQLRAEISGLVGDLIWIFDDGTTITNQNPVEYAFPTTGVHTVRVTASNLTHTTTNELQLTVVAGDVYVAPNGSHLPPFSSWATAATNIQDAIDAAVWGGTVWVTNGVYTTGGRPASGSTQTNRVCVEKPIVVRGAGTRENIVIAGAGHSPTDLYGPAAVRGVYLGHAGAQLIGVTVSGGATDYGDGSNDGGGIFADSTNSIVSDCVLTANSAADEGGAVYGGRVVNSLIVSNYADWGGGGVSQALLSGCRLTNNTASSYGGAAVYSSLSDCQIEGNTASEGGGCAFSDTTRCVFRGNAADSGGGGVEEGTHIGCLIVGNTADYDAGASDAFLYNCTVSDNVAESDSGGVAGCTAINTIVWGNTAPLDPNWSFTAFWHCTTLPLPTGADDEGGNLDSDPQFVSPAAGNYRLQSASPCINAGTNEWWTIEDDPVDLDGAPRILGGRVDMGAYELSASVETAPLGTPLSWLDAYGLGPDWAAAELADPDGDGLPTWKEYIALTNPTEKTSVLTILEIRERELGFEVTFETVEGRIYALERAGAVPAMESDWVDASGPIAGDGAVASVVVPKLLEARSFYRLRVAIAD